MATRTYCPKGLVRLGARTRSRNRVPRRSFVACSPVTSGRSGPRSSAGEPAGQIAARQLEVSRISHALRRAEDLPSDVAAAIEGEAVSR